MASGNDLMWVDEGSPNAVNCKRAQLDTSKDWYKTSKANETV